MLVASLLDRRPTGSVDLLFRGDAVEAAAPRRENVRVGRVTSPEVYFGPPWKAA